MSKLQFFKKPIVILGVICFLAVLIVTLQGALHGTKTYEEGGIEYTKYNNYVIFKQSYFHLIENKDLYQLYPQEHWDLYKYSPTFSLFMGLLAYLPDFLGLLIWNLLNAFVLFFALWKLPFSSDKKRIWAFLFLVIELVTSLQNAQSNGLMAGLIILAFVYLEKKNIALATLCIVATIFIKLFGIVAFALFLFYPNKLKSALYTLGWILLLAVLPLILISPEQLTFLYKSWGNLLQNDHSNSIGFSVSGWLFTWFGLNLKTVSLVVGTLLFCVPFIHYKYFNEVRFRLLYLASILLWIVIFNHKAESPTFVIAVTGVAIWFFTQEFNKLNFSFLILALLFTVLAATDLFPKFIRDYYFIPYVVKAIPCIFIWGKITWELIFYSKNKLTISNN
jgi:hypothetical protein